MIPTLNPAASPIAERLVLKVDLPLPPLPTQATVASSGAFLLAAVLLPNGMDGNLSAE
jgi:hypothetical protein